MNIPIKKRGRRKRIGAETRESRITQTGGGKETLINLLGNNVRTGSGRTGLRILSFENKNANCRTARNRKFSIGTNDMRIKVRNEMFKCEKNHYVYISLGVDRKFDFSFESHAVSMLFILFTPLFLTFSPKRIFKPLRYICPITFFFITFDQIFSSFLFYFWGDFKVIFR